MKKQTQIFIETPYRNGGASKSILHGVSPRNPALYRNRPDPGRRISTDVTGLVMEETA